MTKIKNLQVCLWTALCLFISIFLTANIVNAKAAEYDKTMYIGQNEIVTVSIKNIVKYKSSDTSIAYINKEGMVTAKKEGTVTIKAVNKKGKKEYIKINVCNKKKNKKPAIPVVFDEIEKNNVSIVQEAENQYTYTANIKNNSATGKIKKVIYTYEIQTKKASSEAAVKTKTVKLKFKDIAAGDVSADVSCNAGYTGEYSDMLLKSIELYSGSALYIYDAEGDEYSLKWSTVDKKGPVFSGWVNKNSVYKSQIYKTYYSDKRKTYDFTDNISAEDNRDGPVDIEVDTSGINWKKDGVYKIKYTAMDKAGNKTKAWAKAQVYVTTDVDYMADDVLKAITQESWNKEKKARAIYAYVRSHCSYIDNGPHKDWRKVAENGLKYGSGDCFTYYSVAKILLDRAGIMNFTITRYPVYSAHHWWNLVYVKNGWYHFDTTPRRGGGVFCLITDKQLATYDLGKNRYQYKSELYPERATKEISETPKSK